jgi:pilus assembly protein Flp/PilA
MVQLFVTLQALLADRLERDDKGATLVEYGLLVGLIAIVSILAITTLGVSIQAMFGRIGDALAPVAN